MTIQSDVYVIYSDYDRPSNRDDIIVKEIEKADPLENQKVSSYRLYLRQKQYIKRYAQM